MPTEITPARRNRDRLLNWALCSRGGAPKAAQSNTGFICDRMRTAALGELGTPVSGADRLDHADAALVERAWKGLQPKYRELLRWHYIRTAPPWLICRRLGLRPRPTTIFDIELARAEAEIALVLYQQAPSPNARRFSAPAN